MLEDEKVGDGTLEEGQELFPSAELSDQNRDEADEPTGTDKALKDTKAELTRKSQELSELKERMARMEGMVEATAKGKPEEAAEDPFDWLNADNFEEEVLADGKNTVDAFKRIVGIFGKAINERDAYWNHQFQELQGKLTDVDPSRSELNSKIAQLRKDPDFAKLPREALEVFAKKSMGGMEYRGSPGGGARAPARPAGMDKEVERYMKRLGYMEE